MTEKISGTLRKNYFFILFAFWCSHPAAHFHFQQTYMFQSLVIYINAYLQLYSSIMTISPVLVMPCFYFIQSWIAANSYHVQVLTYLYNCLSLVEYHLPGTSHPLKALTRMFWFVLSLPSLLALAMLVIPIKDTLIPGMKLLRPHISNT